MFNVSDQQGVGRAGRRVAWLFVLSAMTAVVSTGCCVNRGGSCTSCQGGGDPWVINDGGMFDPAHGDRHSCSDGGCGSHRPLSLVRKAFTCGAGCSNEIYVDEWLSDPPDCTDPCNNCGDWVGPRALSPKMSPLGWCNLFGIRNGGDCGGCGSCASCGSEGFIGGDVHYEGEVIEGPMRVIDDRAVTPGKAEGKSAPMRQPTPPPDTDARRSQKRPFRLSGVRTHSH